MTTNQFEKPTPKPHIEHRSTNNRIWVQNGSQNESKWSRHVENNRFWAQNGSQNGAKWSRKLEKNCRKTCPKKKGAWRLILTILGSFRAPFWEHFGIIFCDKIGVGVGRGFDMDLGCFWTHFWELFGSEICSF